MKAATQPPPAVLVTSNDLVGLGNRVPAIITSYVMALLTKRVLLLQSSVLEYMDTPFPADWREFEQHYKNSSACIVDWRMLTNSSLEFCDSTAPHQQQQLPAVLSGGAPPAGSRWPDLIRYSSIDYDLPLLQVNPALKPHFRKFFPDGEVFHSAAQFLLRPNPVLQAAMLPYLPDSGRCLVGMHIRTRKYAGVRPRHFTSIARMLAQGKDGTVFVASDAGLFDRVQAAMPGHRVWWSSHTSNALAAASETRGRNPGSEISAVLDVLLLSKCEQLVLTPASSMGAIAAGFGGVKPVFANFGKHKDPFLNPWFWRSVTSEPCFFKASAMHMDTSAFAATFRNEHPLFLYHNQCHYQQHLRVVPQRVPAGGQQMA
jgi:xyloglucan fucosyltransferase